MLKNRDKTYQQIREKYAAIRRMKAMQLLTRAAQKATAINAVVESTCIAGGENKPSLLISFFFNSDNEVVELAIEEY